MTLFWLALVVSNILVAFGLSYIIDPKYYNAMMFLIIGIDLLIILYLISRPRGRSRFYFFKKGKHKDSLRFNIGIGKEHFKISFRISNECWVSKDFSDQQREQINKIWGISYHVLPRIRIRDGKLRFFRPHHWNSRRIGFCSSYQKGMFLMYLYEYKNGVRTTTMIGQFRADEVITVDTTNLVQTMNVKINPNVVYYLYPYIGGMLPAHQPQGLFLNVIYS